MPLLQQQIFLGRCLLAADVEEVTGETSADFVTKPDDAASLHDLVRGPGFRFTRHIQRSWCIARTAGAARLTLSALAPEQRRRVVEDWVDAGGGNALDVTTEAAGFLEFVAQRLPDPSHALSVCRMEQAAYRASAAAASFTAVDPTVLDDPDTVLRTGSGAALVRFLTAPRRLFEALAGGKPLPPPDDCFAYLFAPGLPTLRRPAREHEAAVWDRLSTPIAVRVLCDEGFSRPLMSELLAIGAIEPGRSR
jgi:hypothetical protein